MMTKHSSAVSVLMVVLLVHAGYTVNYHRDSNPVKLVQRAYHCVKGHCVRTRDYQAVNDDGIYGHLEGCKSVCGKYGSLWPRPNGGHLKISSKLNAFTLDDLAVKLDLAHFAQDQSPLELALSDALVTFTQNLQHLEQSGDQIDPSVKQHQVLVKITVEGTASMDWTLSTERESYSLAVLTRMASGRPRDDVQIFINAQTYYGAIYGLETLSQLITYRKGLHFVPSNVRISDRPVYPYRGILLDTSRNFFSIESIKRIIDGMVYNKLNVFHWHLTDTQSFPFASQRVPQMASYGAYSQRYENKDILTLF